MGPPTGSRTAWNTVILGGSSVLTIFGALVTAKLWALWLGPSGFGLLGLLQGLLQFTAIVVANWIGYALVQCGVDPDAARQAVGMAALRRSAWAMTWMLAAFTVFLFWIFRAQISSLALGDAHYGSDVVWIGIALALTGAYCTQLGVINAYHDVKSLAQIGALTAILGTGVLLAVVYWFRTAGIAPALAANAAVGVLLGHAFRRRIPTVDRAHAPYRALLAKARELVRFGVPLSGSMLVGTGVQRALPIFILPLLGAIGVGFYRAAAGITVRYLWLFTTAIEKDYFPRLVAARNRPEELHRRVNDQHRLLMGMATLWIVTAIALTPLLVPILYTRDFIPTIGVLEWQLMGDIPRLAGWIMEYAILVECGSLVYFGIELATGITLLLVTWLAISIWGLVGAGIAYFITYCVYFLIVCAIAYLRLHLVWTGSNLRMLAGAAGALVAVRTAELITWVPMRITLIALCLLGLAVFCLRDLMDLMRHGNAPRQDWPAFLLRWMRVAPVPVPEQAGLASPLHPAPGGRRTITRDDHH